jgi:hypothetical protein
MTLILACLTPNTVYQVSDRRITNLLNPNEVITDDQNKSVMIDSRFVFGYTGLSKMEGERTDTWLAKVISQSDTNDMAAVANHIRESANRAFQQTPGPKKNLRYAFQGVGWLRLQGESNFSPASLTIHNAIDPRTGMWLAEPRDEFQLNTNWPSQFPNYCVMESVGVIPSLQEKDAVFRLVRRCIKRRSSTPLTVLEALIRSLRWLSMRHQTVGPGMMVVCLPKRAAEEAERTGRRLVFPGMYSEVAPTFVYIPARKSAKYFGPHFVSKGVVLTDFQAGGVLPSSTDAQVERVQGNDSECSETVL